MTILDAETYDLGLTQEEKLGFALSMSREELRDVLYNGTDSEEYFGEAMSEYLNAVQGYYFEGSEGQHYDVLQSPVAAIRTEVQTLLKISIDDKDTCIEESLLTYSEDSKSLILEHFDMSTLPRAFNLTLLDAIDRYRPVNPSVEA